MTREYDICRFYFKNGYKDLSCTRLGLDWPPPEELSIGKHKFKRLGLSKVSEAELDELPWLVRGAEYELIEK